MKIKYLILISAVILVITGFRNDLSSKFSDLSNHLSGFIFKENIEKKLLSNINMRVNFY